MYRPNLENQKLPILHLEVNFCRLINTWELTLSSQRHFAGGFTVLPAECSSVTTSDDQLRACPPPPPPATYHNSFYPLPTVAQAAYATGLLPFVSIASISISYAIVPTLQPWKSFNLNTTKMRKLLATTWIRFDNVSQ